MDVISAAHAALGAAIRQLRLDQGVSQEGLAYKAGVHRTYMGAIERGEQNVAYTNLRKVAGALGVPASRLVAIAEDREREPSRRSG